MRAPALALLLVAAAACGAGRAGYGDQRLPEVRDALLRGGLEICTESRDPDGFANEATETHVLRVATDCDDDEPVRLIVDRFDDVDARDAAAQQFEVLSRPRSDGVVWTLGAFTIFANGARDDDVMDRVTDALDAAGAK